MSTAAKERIKGGSKNGNPTVWYMETVGKTWQ